MTPLLFAGCYSQTSATQRATVNPAAPTDISVYAREFPVPTVKLPNPNGYDLLVQSAQSIQHGGESSPEAREKLAPEEDLRRQRAFTAKNARPLELVQQALQLPIMVPRARGLRAPAPPYAKFRSLMRLMTQRNRVYAADKQWDKAINGALDIVQMGTALQNGGNAIGVLTGIAIQSYGYYDLPRWVANCDAKTALAAVERMKSLEAEMTKFSPVMPEAKWDGLVELQEILASPDWKKFRGGDDNAWGRVLKTDAERRQVRALSDSKIQRNYLAAMDKVIAQAKLPFSRDVKELPPAADPFSQYLATGTTVPANKTRALFSGVKGAHNLTVHRLLRTAFALQAFHKTHGRYPQKLDELAGK